MRAAQNPAVQQACGLEVGPVQSAAGVFIESIVADRTRADHLECLCHVKVPRFRLIYGRRPRATTLRCVGVAALDLPITSTNASEGPAQPILHFRRMPMRYSMLSQFFMLTVCVALVGAQDQPKGKQQDLFQQYLEKFGPPGPGHKSLEPLVGNWHEKCQIWHDP